MIGSIVSHYHILSKAGEGGMGVVYKALDTKLDRHVAIKFLPPQLQSDQNAKARFIGEAKAASALNHSNIAVVHEINETSDGQMFIVMAYYEGQTLKDKLKDGPLDVDEAITIVCQIAAGAGKAHEKGILHRDIKPANVLLGEDGQAKLADFGLATLATGTRLTRTGTAVGTVAYMSPEQLNAGSIDRRSDVWSLGVLLYELVTGRLPFKGDVEPAMIHSIMNKDSDSVTEYRPQAPPGLDGIIARALEKGVEDRYPDMESFRVDLLKLLNESGRGPSAQRQPSPTQAEAGDGPKRLAVLPFENLSADPDQDFFVDGMHEEVLATLAGIGGLEVISRTSVRQYKDGTSSLSKIARDLRVSSIVEGSVRATGGQVRITVQLVDALADRHLWANSYQRELRDILTLQGEIAKAIALEVKATLTPEEEARLKQARQVDPESYSAYLRGRYNWGKRTPEAISQAGKFFQEAIDADPTYAMAYAGLADCYLMKGAAFYAVQDPREAYPRARSAAEKAMELDPTLAEPHATLGYLKTFFDYDAEGSAEQFGEAIKLNPSYATAHLWSALRLTALGQFDEALDAVDRALQLDPLSLICIADKGWIYFHARQYDEAIRENRKALEVDPGFAVAHWGIGLALEQQGEHVAAETSIRTALDLAKGNLVYQAALARALALNGKNKDANRYLDELMSRRERGLFLPAADLAYVYLAKGETDDAIRALETAYEQKENAMALLNADPRVDPLRSHPRFKQLLQRIGFTL